MGQGGEEEPIKLSFTTDIMDLYFSFKSGMFRGLTFMNACNLMQIQIKRGSSEYKRGGDGGALVEVCQSNFSCTLLTYNNDLYYYLILSGSAASCCPLSPPVASPLPRSGRSSPAASSPPCPACLGGWRSPRSSAPAPPAARTGCPRRSWRSRTRRRPAGSP